MRGILWSMIGLAMLLPGCCGRESAATSERAAKSARPECKVGDCCSSVSRSSLLQNAAGESK